MVAYCPTADQVAALLTEAVKFGQFVKLWRKLGVVSFD